MLAPYRTEAPIDKYVPKKYGLIKRSGQNPWGIFPVFLQIFVELLRDIKASICKHRCGYPKWTTRLGCWFIGKPFAEDSLYRCSCGKIWKSRYNGKWEENDYYIRYWLEAGGEK